jgi:hypothetical protein
MHRSTVPVLIAALAIAAPGARAQARYELSPFASRNSSLDGSPFLMGATLTTYSSSLGGIFGMRFGGGYDMRALGGASTTGINERGWVADADAVVSPARFPVIGPLLGGFLPTVFTGVGVEGIRRSDGTGGQGVVTSYGVGVTRSLGGLASVDIESRRRMPVGLGGSSTDESPITRRGWEYRLGFSIGFGGSSRPKSGLPSIPIPGAPRAARRVDPPPTASGTAVISTGDEYLGTKYSYGGAAPQTGFDCSGFVQYVYRQNGVTLPRTSRQQAAAGRSLSVKLDGVRAGDLLFFSQNGNAVDHVAIYAGSDRILHSTSSGGGVRYDDLTTARGKWFTDRLVAVRRVLGDGQTFVDPTIASNIAPTLDPPDKAPKPN